MHLRIDQIAGIEEIPGSVRTNPYLKVFVAGYTFHIDEPLSEFLKKIGEAAI